MGKGLDALEKLYPKTTYMPYYTRSEKRAFCKIIEKELKALEIIKNHGTNHTLNEVIYSTCYKDYRILSMSNHHCVEYSEEEYDLLKEVML